MKLDSLFSSVSDVGDWALVFEVPDTDISAKLYLDGKNGVVKICVCGPEISGGIVFLRNVRGDGIVSLERAKKQAITWLKKNDYLSE